MTPVTDPSILAQLNGGMKPVSDPALLAQLNGGEKPAITDDMSTWDRLKAGVGQGMAEVGLGAEQLAAHAPGLFAGLGNPSALIQTMGDPEWKKQVDEAAKEKAKLDAPLLDTGAGKVGAFLGQTAATLPAGAIGGSGGVIANMAKTGAQGALVGALQPVADVKQPTTLTDLVTGGNKGGEDYLAAKFRQAATGGAFGAGTSAALRGLTSAVNAMRPSNLTAATLNAFNRGANETPFAQEGERLAAQTGVDLTPAQVSGSKAMSQAENAARQSIYSRDIAFQGDQRRTQQLADYFDRTMTGIANSDASPVAVGQQVRGATQKIIGSLEKARSDQAARDFGAIRSLTNGQAAIEPANTNTLLKSILEENSGIGTPGGDALANFARKQLSNVAPATQSALTDIDRAAISHFGGADKMTPDVLQVAERWSPGITQRLEGASNTTAPAQGNLDKLMQLRSYLSKVAGGQAKISGETQDRRIAAQLLGSIDQDIESASSQIGGDLGSMLKQANANYRAASQQIDSIHASPLGKILGEDFTGALQSGQFNSIPPEVVAQRLNALKPSQIGVVRGILEKQDPDAWSVMKRGMLQDAIEKASAIPPSEGANAAVLRPNVLIKNMGDAKRLQAAFDPQELSQIQAGLDVARRLADKTGYNFSGTAGQNELLSLLNNPLGAVKNAINKGASYGANIATAGMGAKAVARLMTDANGRAALLQLKTLPPNSVKARELTAYLATVLNTESANQPDQ